MCVSHNSERYVTYLNAWSSQGDGISESFLLTSPHSHAKSSSPKFSALEEEVRPKEGASSTTESHRAPGDCHRL